MADISRIEEIVSTYRPSAARLDRFRFWHVEPLLNQAADLLDRCLKERSDYNSLRAQWHNSVQSMTEAARDEAVLDQRIQHGWLNTAGAVLQHQIDVKEGASAHHDAVETLIVGVQNGNAPPNRSLLEADRHRNWLAQKILKMEVEVTKIQRDWEIEEKAFKINSFQNAIQNRQDRGRLMNWKDDNAPLNFYKQCIEQQKLITRDFEDAFDRAKIARIGLKSIYHHETPTLDGLLGSPDAIVELAGWVREAIRWLAAFSQLDQGFTKVISVRHILQDDTIWQTAINTGGGVADFAFELGPNFFSDHSYVRMRGLSAFVVGGNLGRSVWSGKVKLPEEAQSIYRDENDSTKRVDPKLPQDGVPYCTLGRIESRDTMRPPEVAGMISLMNASPISAAGKAWKLSIKEPAGRAPGLNKLEDVEIELQLAARPGQ